MEITLDGLFAHSLNAMEKHNEFWKKQDQKAWFLKQDEKTLKAIYKRLKV